MSIDKDVENILIEGFEDTDALINPIELDNFEKSLEKLSPHANKKKGYSLPQIDTIGVRLQDNLECSIKDI